MKKMLLALVLGFILMMNTNLIMAAEVTTSTQITKTSPAKAVEATQFDARHTARAILSHQATTWFSGNYSYNLELTDGTKFAVSGDYKAQYYWVDNQPVFKYYELSQSLNGTYPPIQYGGDPLDVFPYPVKGLPTNFGISINGWDKDGNPTQSGSYSAMTWRAGDPIIYWMKPGNLPVFVPFDLNGRDPNSVGLAVDGWGGGTISYDMAHAGFYVWVDPTQTYSGKIVDRYNFGATIVSVPSFRFDDLPASASTAPSCSVTNFQWVDGIKSISFDQNGYYQPETQSFGTNVVDGGQTVPAGVYIVQENDLQGGTLVGSLMNFAGKIQIEAFTDPSQKGTLILDQTWTSPGKTLEFDVPEGYRSVMITIIKSDTPVAVPVGWSWDPWLFNLMIGRAWGGKG